MRTVNVFFSNYACGFYAQLSYGINRAFDIYVYKVFVLILYEWIDERVKDVDVNACTFNEIPLQNTMCQMESRMPLI